MPAKTLHSPATTSLPHPTIEKFSALLMAPGPSRFLSFSQHAITSKVITVSSSVKSTVPYAHALTGTGIPTISKISKPTEVLTTAPAADVHGGVSVRVGKGESTSISIPSLLSLPPPPPRIIMKLFRNASRLGFPSSFVVSSMFSSPSTAPTSPLPVRPLPLWNPLNSLSPGGCTDFPVPFLSTGSAAALIHVPCERPFLRCWRRSSPPLSGSAVTSVCRCAGAAPSDRF